MEEQISHIEELLERTEHYVKSSTELYKLKAIDKLADLIAALAGRLTIILIWFFFFVIFNIGIALLIGEHLGKFSLGFLIISGIYALVGILFYIFRKKWSAIIKNTVIGQVLK